MHRRNVAVVRVVVRAAGRKVNGTADLFVKQDIPHRFGHVRVDADGEFADIARALVGIEYGIDLFGKIARGGNNLAVLKGERNVFKLRAVLNGRRVIRDFAVDAVSYGRGIHFAVGNIHVSRALHRADPFDRKGKIGIFCHKANLVGLVH